MDEKKNRLANRCELLEDRLELHEIPNPPGFPFNFSLNSKREIMAACFEAKPEPGTVVSVYRLDKNDKWKVVVQREIEYYINGPKFSLLTNDIPVVIWK